VFIVVYMTRLSQIKILIIYVIMMCATISIDEKIDEHMSSIMGGIH